MDSIVPNDIETIKDVSYSIAIGCLMHAMTYIRYNIAFDIGQVAKFIDNLCWAHWFIVKHIMNCIKGTLNYKIIYQNKKMYYLHINIKFKVWVKII